MKESKDTKAVWAVVSGTVGIALGVGLMVPAVTPAVREIPSPTETVTACPVETPAPEPTPTPTETQDVPPEYRAAAGRAQMWMDELNWSPARIREYLVDQEGFTEEAAEYGISQLR